MHRLLLSNQILVIVIPVIYDGYKFSFWYIEASAYYVHNVVYLCRSLLEQKIELVLICFISNSKITEELGIMTFSMYEVDRYGISSVVERAIEAINPR